MMNWLFEQMVKRPAAAFGASLELLDRRLRGRQLIDGMVSRLVHTLNHGADETPVNCKPLEKQEPINEPPPQNTAAEAAPSAVEGERPVAGSSDEAADETADKGLQDDLLKLVHYQVLFVRRDFETTLSTRTELLAENLDEAAFTAWKIAEFIQDLQSGLIPTPPRWRERPPPGAELRDGNLVALQSEEKKYLRVNYEVRERYPRRAFNYEQRQLKALRQIRDALSE
jgi:hypothetical protein